MSTFLSLLPVYLIGNFHCIGMCGPLVMMVGSHKWKMLYFLGRTLSFTLAATIAGSLGAVLHLFLKSYHISFIFSLLLGVIFLLVGIGYLKDGRFIPLDSVSEWLAPLNQKLTRYLLTDRPEAMFCFGFFTVFLPCGQTLIVFSACALSGSAVVGFFNGLAFALLTSPSLLFAMKAHQVILKAKNAYNAVLGIGALLIGGLTICRGLAEAGVIPHLVLYPNWHIMLY